MYAVLEHLGWTLGLLLYLFIVVAIAWMLIFVLAWLAGGARRAMVRRFRGDALRRRCSVAPPPPDGAG